MEGMNQGVTRSHDRREVRHVGTYDLVELTLVWVGPGHQHRPSPDHIQVLRWIYVRPLGGVKWWLGVLGGLGRGVTSRVWQPTLLVESKAEAYH